MKRISGTSGHNCVAFGKVVVQCQFCTEHLTALSKEPQLLEE